MNEVVPNKEQIMSDKDPQYYLKRDIDKSQRYKNLGKRKRLTTKRITLH